MNLHRRNLHRTAVHQSGHLVSVCRFAGVRRAHPWRMNHEELKRRTAAFARDIAMFAAPLLTSGRTVDPGRQLQRAASAVAANYRSTGLSRSRAEFAARMGTVAEEADEAVYWLEYLRDANLATHRDLMLEAVELRNIFVSSYATARRNQRTAATDRRNRHHRPARRNGRA